MEDGRYRSLEGRLYGLGGPPRARIASPRVASPHPRSPGPRGPFREIEGRLDLSIAMATLTPDERTVIHEHYISGRRRHPGQVRRAIIEKLDETLDRG